MLDKFHFIKKPFKERKNKKKIDSERFRSVCSFFLFSCLYFKYEYNKEENVNKIPTRYNSMQIFIYYKVTLHVSGVTAPIIRSTNNCNRSCTSIMTCTGGCGYNF